jgi:tetratricopeptide (TPR) repeat protein
VPWLPIGVGAAALAAVIVAIVLASGGDGDANRTASTTPKKSPSSSTTTKKPASSSSSQTTTPPPAPPPPPSPPPAGTGTGTGSGSGSGSASASALNDQGYRLQQAGNNTAAVPILRRSVKAFRDSGDTTSTNYSYAIYNLGVSLLAVGRAEEAIPYLEERLNNFDDRDAVVRKTLQQAQAQVGGATATTPKAKTGNGQ